MFVIVLVIKVDNLMQNISFLLEFMGQIYGISFQNLLEELSECLHLKTILARRYVNFFKSLLQDSLRRSLNVTSKQCFD